MKLKSKKIVLFSLLPLLLQSCNKGDTSTITVIWWNNYFVPETESDRENTTKFGLYLYAEKVIQDFEQKHPNVKIKTKYYSDYAAINADVKAGKGSGNFPSMALGYPDYAQNHLHEGIPLSNMMDFISDSRIGFSKVANENATFEPEDEQSNYKDDSSTSYDDLNKNYIDIEKGMYNQSELYSMPYSKSGEVLFVNDSVFSKDGAGSAGTTITNQYGTYTAPISTDSKVKYELDENYTFLDLIDIAKQVQKDYPEIYPVDSSGNPTYLEDDSSRKLFKAIPLVVDSSDNLFITICQQLNIDYINPNGTGASGKILFNNDEAKQVVKQLKKWSDQGLFCTRDQLSYMDAEKTRHQYGTTYFEEGKTMMIVLSTPNAPYFAENGYVSKVYKYPQYTKTAFGLENNKQENYSVISQGPSMLFFKDRDSRVERASFEFYKELTSSSNSAKLAIANNYFPIRTSSYEDELIKTIIDNGTSKENDTVVSSSIKDKQDVLYSKIYDYNMDYTDNNSYFMTKATTYSSTVRSAVKEMMVTVLSDKTAKSDEEINTLINTAFKNAYDKVVNTETIE